MVECRCFHVGFTVWTLCCLNWLKHKKVMYKYRTFFSIKILNLKVVYYQTLSRLNCFSNTYTSCTLPVVPPADCLKDIALTHFLFFIFFFLLNTHKQSHQSCRLFSRHGHVTTRVPWRTAASVIRRQTEQRCPLTQQLTETTVWPIRAEYQTQLMYILHYFCPLSHWTGSSTDPCKDRMKLSNSTVTVKQ